MNKKDASEDLRKTKPRTSGGFYSKEGWERLMEAAKRGGKMTKDITARFHPRVRRRYVVDDGLKERYASWCLGKTTVRKWTVQDAAIATEIENWKKRNGGQS